MHAGKNWTPEKDQSVAVKTRNGDLQARGQAAPAGSVGCSENPTLQWLPGTHQPAVPAVGRQAALPLQLGMQGLQPRREGDAVALRSVLSDGRVEEAHFDFLLAATGRRPNLDRLGLEHAGIALDENGTPVGWDRRTARIGESTIFLAGDAAPDAPLLHEASDAGRIAGENAARFPFVAPRHRRTPIGVVFSDPQIAMVGQSHAQLSRAKASFITGSVDFTGQGRSRVAGRNVGRLNIYAHPLTGKFLGAEMVGPAAEHIAHLLRFMLEREGYNVMHAGDGREGLRLIETQPAPAVALLDVMLPFVDGFELVRRLRGQPGWSAVPVLMLTAKTQEKDIVRALDAGANDVESTEDGHDIWTSVDSLHEVAKALEAMEKQAN